MPKEKLKVISSGSAPLISAMIRKMGITRHLDEIIDWDRKRCNLSPGTRLAAFIINILTDRQPLYHISDFYQDHDCEVLFGHGVKAEHFTDDAMARMLDLLNKVDKIDLYGQLAMMVHQSIYGHNNLKDMHLDRTTISLFGAYDGEETPGACKVNRGYSKDRRPDLKQFSAGLAVNSDGLPVLCDVGSGNQPENPWFRTFIPRLAAQHAADELDEFTAIADAAFVSEDNLSEFINSEGTVRFSFISRLPATFSEEKNVKEKALGNRSNWVELGRFVEQKTGATYQCHSDTVSINGVLYRALVFASSSLSKQKENTLNKAWQKQKESLLKDCKAAMTSFYACEADARKAAEAVISAHSKGVWTTPYEIVDTSGQVTYFTPQQGRSPKRQTVSSNNDNRIQLVFGEPIMDEAKAVYQRDMASLFVLITNIPAEKACDREILRRYKEQHKVEVGFRFLKGPCTLGPVYLNKESRIEALATVFLIAYLVGMAIQIRVRRGVASRERKLNVGYRVTDAPTIRVILDLLDSVQVVQDEKGIRTSHNFRYDYMEVLEDCGLDTSIWTEIPD